MNLYLLVPIVLGIIAIALIEANHRGWMRGFHTASKISDGLVTAQQAAIELLTKALIESYEELAISKHKLTSHNGG